MDYYKLKPKSTDYRKITKENFEADTDRNKLYYPKNKKSQYAVCPACDNPITIIGLYNPDTKVRPYGKHYPKSVDNLAVYNRFRYESCPYASHVWEDTKRVRKKEIDGISKEVIEFMNTNFDSVIRLLRKFTGIIFNDKLIEEMLQQFFCVEGYNYHHINIANCAWIFGYMQWRVKFYGMKLDKSHEVYQAISQHPLVKLENDTILTNNGFIIPEFYLMLHKTKKKNNRTSEYITYCIDINDDKVFRKEYKIDLELMSSILNRKTAKTINDIRYIDMFKTACKKYLTL